MAKWSAVCWVIACSPSGPSAWLDLGSEVDDHPGVVDELAHPGDQRRAGTAGQQRRSGGHPYGMTEPVDRHAGPGQIPVADQADGPPPVQGVGQPIHHVRLGVADRLHPQPSPEGEEVGVRVRIEHLDHGGDREAAQTGPGAGQIPVATVRQHHDRPRLGLSTAQPGCLRHLHPGHDLVGPPAGQGEHLGQRPQVRAAGPRPPAGRRPGGPRRCPGCAAGWSGGDRGCGRRAPHPGRSDRAAVPAGQRPSVLQPAR